MMIGAHDAVFVFEATHFFAAASLTLRARLMN
jgi:hypothetical protein